MLKSKRTLRKPIEPVNAEYIGTAFEGLDNLPDLVLKCALIRVDVIRYRSLGWDTSGSVVNGSVTLSHPRDGSVVWTGLNAFDGEPDLTHLEAALTEYATWLDYWDIHGWTAFTPVASGIFSWQNPAGAVVAGTPIPHDLWVDDTGSGWAESLNVIIAPSQTQI